MSRDDASLLDIHEAAQQILSYAQDFSRSELQADRMRVSAILYQVLIIGEATKRLSSEFRLQYPQIPWSNMAGMRDMIVHEYDRIDFGILWGVIQSSIPDLLEMIAPLLPEESNEG